MNYEERRRLFRTGEMDKAACGTRLTAGRIAAGYDRAKDFAEAIGARVTTYNSQEKGVSNPSLAAMAELYVSHRIDFNFILYGEFSHLDPFVREALEDALRDVERSPDRRYSSD